MKVVQVILSLLWCGSFADAKRPGVLRRQKVDRESYRECPRKGPDAWILFSSDMPEASMGGPFFDMNLSAHREILNYDDDDVASMWSDAYAHFLHRYGVEISPSAEVDPNTGTIFSDNGQFMVVAATPFFGDTFTIMGSSVSGPTNDCPLLYRTEMIGITPMPGAVYHGTFGGEEGLPALTGDLIMFGHHMMDLDQDGVWEAIRYQTRVPSRVTNGVELVKDLELFSDTFGPGRQFGYCTFDNQGHDERQFGVGLQMFFGAHLSFP